MLNMVCLDEAFKKKLRIRREKAICSGHVFFNSYFNVQHINFSHEGVISDCCREEIAVRNAMLENAAKKVFLCHGGKFGTRSAYRQCSLGDVDYLITEGNCPEDFTKIFPALTIL